MLVAPLLAGICQHPRFFDGGVVSCANGAPGTTRLEKTCAFPCRAMLGAPNYANNTLFKSGGAIGAIGNWAVGFTQNASAKFIALIPLNLRLHLLLCQAK